MSITCPGCKGQIEISEDLYGAALACPHCEHLFQLNKKGELTKYVVPSAGGGNNKPMIIGVSLSVVCVIVGLVFLIKSGAKNKVSTASVTPPASAPATDTPKPDSSSEPETDMATMASLADGEDPAASMEPLPPVEIPDTPDGMVLAVAHALADGNPRGIWDALPASYQTDVNDLIHQAAETADPLAWDMGFSIASRLVGVLRDKKEFVMGNQMLAMNPKKDEIAAGWDGMVGLLSTVTESDLAKLDSLKTLDVGDFLGTTGAKFMTDIESLAGLAPSNKTGNDLAALRNITVTVLNTTEGVAEVEMKIPGVTNQTEKFIQVEGRWVPQEIASDWDEQMKGARAGIEKATKEKQQTSAQAMMMMGMVEGLLATFENANSQPEFDQALGGAFGMFMQMFGGAGGPGGPGGGDMGGPGMDGPPPGFDPSMRPPSKKGKQPPRKKGKKK
jgi:hypothetical protein